jgi:phage shock protein PspC (stress-responsive transcriptional regulator)
MSQQTPPHAPSSPPSAPPSGAPSTGNRFFAWMRSIDIPRRPGWIGGVCAGVAARLGIDPLIVRGIAVVLAVLGAPALLLYGVAWLLLPDENNKIHLEEVTRGRFEAPLAGIGVIFFLSLLPITEGFWFLGAEYWGAPGWTDSFGRAVWTLLLFAAIIGFVIWLARRADTPQPPPAAGPMDARGASGAFGASAPGVPAPGPTPTSGGPTAFATATPPTYVDDPSASSVPGTPAASFVPTVSGAPAAAAAPQFTSPPPGAGAPPEEVAAWRERQAQWKAEHDAFRHQQASDKQAATRAAHERARAERQVRYAAERAARARTRSHPLFSFTVIGLALIAGGLVTLATAGSFVEVADVALGLAVTLAVLAVGIVVNGVRGKRSGGASGFAFLVVIGMIVVAAIPAASNFRSGWDIEFTPRDQLSSETQTFVVGFGEVTMDLTDFYANSPRGDVAGAFDSVLLVAGAADVTVIVPADEYINLNTDMGAGDVYVIDADGNYTDINSGEDTFLNTLSDEDGWDGDERYLDLSIRLGAGDITLVEAGTEGAR